jgi:hypothetical protein
MVPAEFVTMTQSVPQTAVLVRYPGAASQAVQGLEARVWWTQHAALAFTHILKGGLALFPILLPGALSEDDHLWQHTCFEAFVSVKGHPAYFMAKNVHAMRDSRAPCFLLFTPLPPSSVTL